MTESINRYGIYKVDHTKFGGIIYPSDFNTDYRGKVAENGSAIANRIIKDSQFDKQCKANKENNSKIKNGRK